MVVTDEREKSQAYDRFRKHLKRLSKQLNFKDDEEIFRAHRFRRTFAMRILNHYKAPLFAVTKMLGVPRKPLEKIMLIIPYPQPFKLHFQP